MSILRCLAGTSIRTEILTQKPTKGPYEVPLNPHERKSIREDLAIQIFEIKL